MCTFAAVKLDNRRHIASWLLLAVFVPMLIFSCIHVHEEVSVGADTECADCVHHSCHGHLTSTASWAHDCVLCQFISLTFVAAAVAAVAVVFNVLWILYAPKQYAIYSTTRGCIVTRGPPAE